MLGRRTGGFRVDGLRLIIVAVSAVGLITTYSALQIYRFGDFSASIRQQLDESAARLAAIDGFAASAGAGAVAALAALPGWDEADRALLAEASQAGADSRDLARRLQDSETARRDGLVALWGKTSATLSQSLSLSLASIVVLLFTVILRSLAYLSSRDRTEAQLRRARAEAEAANAAKTDFLATMSHEIRTPLTAIRGYADLLGQSPLDATQRDRLQKLRDAGAVLSGLIDDILDLSRIEAGRIDLHPQAIDLRALADRVIALVTPTATAKGLTLKAAADRDVPRFLYVDGTRLLQVLLNLTNNAVKFTDKGGVTLTLSRSGAHLAIGVTDTGIGIAAEDLPRLFKRFSQIDSSLTRAHGGSGLGLAISRGLVERMGGRITVESAPDAGSRFTILLPLDEATEPEPESAPPRPLPAATRPGRILVVEDSDQNQDLIAAVLGQAGHTCLQAWDGIEGVEAARRGGFDLVIMDMQMPRMDGITATAAIRALPAPAGAVPILALSANALPAQTEAMLQAGAGRHLAKPFALDDLVAAVAAMLGPDRQPQPESAPAPKETPPAPMLHDPEALDALVALLGTDWVRGRLDAVLGDMGWITAETETTALRKRAHRLISESGQLGLPALAEAALALESACDSGAPLDAPRSALAACAAEVQALLPALRARLS